MKYNCFVENNFFKPAHSGVLDTAQADVFSVTAGVEASLQFGTVYIQHDDAKKIVKARFTVRGDPYLIAGLEWLCCELERCSTMQLSRVAISALLGITKKNCSTVLLLEKFYTTIKKKL